jgi:cytochrome c553
MRASAQLGSCLGAAALAISSTALAQAQADKAFGQYLSSECVGCHQLTGRFEGIPPIVGWPEQTFIAIMGEYRQKHRDNPIMQTIAGRLSEQEIAALAAYFASLPAENRK